MPTSTTSPKRRCRCGSTEIFGNYRASPGYVVWLCEPCWERGYAEQRAQDRGRAELAWTPRGARLAEVSRRALGYRLSSFPREDDSGRAAFGQARLWLAKSKTVMTAPDGDVIRRALEDGDTNEDSGRRPKRYDEPIAKTSRKAIVATASSGGRSAAARPASPGRCSGHSTKMTRAAPRTCSSRTS